MNTVQFTAMVWNEGESYVSRCPEIDVASAGSTKEEALSNLTEAVRLWFDNARQIGIVDEYLSLFTAAERTVQIVEISIET